MRQTNRRMRTQSNSVPLIVQDIESSEAFMLVIASPSPVETNATVTPTVSFASLATAVVYSDQITLAPLAG